MENNSMQKIEKKISNVARLQKDSLVMKWNCENNCCKIYWFTYRYLSTMDNIETEWTWVKVHGLNQA